MNRIINFFDKLEDRVRGRLSHSPVLYSVIAALSIVLFWDGITTVTQSIVFFTTFWGGVTLIVVSVTVALMTGIFVSFFIGDTIIMSGLNKEKKVIEKTEEEIHIEANIMHDLVRKVSEIDLIVKDLQNKAHDDIKKR